MGNSFDRLKKSTAEAEMKAAGKEMMKKAAEDKARKEAEKPVEIGNWTLKLLSATEYAEVDVENFKEKLMQFEMQCNAEFPMLRVHIDDV